MRRVLVLLCVVAFVLAGCDSSSEESADGTTSSTDAVAPVTAVEELTTVPTATTSTAVPYPNSDEVVALVESFIDAFYAFDEKAMLATLAPGSPSQDFLTYSLGWAKGASHAVTNRQACEFHEGGVTGKVTCAVTVHDDITKALGMGDVQVTDNYTVYFNDAGITLVEVSPSPAPELAEIDAGFAWIEETYPELFDHGGACVAMFDGGPTPETCVEAIEKGLEEYAAL
jgi:hypothetical protein